MKLEFEMAKPFLPFEQLLAVLPPASRELLPKPLQGLMMNEMSPIIDYYPKDFECDLNGKQQGGNSIAKKWLENPLEKGFEIRFVLSTVKKGTFSTAILVLIQLAKKSA